MFVFLNIWLEKLWEDTSVPKVVSCWRGEQRTNKGHRETCHCMPVFIHIHTYTENMKATAFEKNQND